MDPGSVPASFEPGGPTPLPPEEPPRRPPRRLLHLGLLLLTLLSTTVVGVILSGPEPFSFALLTRVLEAPRTWGQGLPYSLAALFILGCHEMGHYVACRLYRIDSSLPYFLPGPNLFGTFGAVIRIRAPFPTRRALFDVGIAGPIAGFVALIPILLYGLARSTIVPIHPSPGDVGLSSCLLLEILSPLFFRPPQGMTISFHPVFVAAWLGLFATSLNLLPIGQLDGGHVLYALSPRVHAVVSRVGIAVLVVGGLLFGGYHLAMFGILFGILGVGHPRPVDETGTLGRGRLAVAVLGLLLFLLTFFPLSPQVFGFVWR